MNGLDLSSIDWGLIAPLIVIQLILVVVALINLTKQAHTNGPKWLWVLIILFVSMFGPILYFVFGRSKDR
ncbi:PLD nuclease N-terminal domain-containing protein [Lederbergia citrea]|uniref:PLD nuclease N-terminal domain-containing protein n=1 Tax=Lederbergia citrea TaxID=2833581 RepID=UPI001BC9E741|nr:PLD nuclease N-terminal domain-containing protein [Lederbergia citrea]MBS4178882.1 PLDc_N domain-containing protein [Lederbergia citrea]